MALRFSKKMVCSTTVSNHRSLAMVRLSINSLHFRFVDGGNVQPCSQSVGLGLPRPARQPRLATAKCLLEFWPLPKCFRAPSKSTKKGFGATWNQKRPYRTSRGSFSRLFRPWDFYGFSGTSLCGCLGGCLAGWLAGWQQNASAPLAHTTLKLAIYRVFCSYGHDTIKSTL